MRAPLTALQNAVKRMFDDMNAAFMAARDWQFGQQHIERQISTFLIRFDAIFTLNQDLLLEHHYAKRNIALTGKKKWAGHMMPGMRPTWPQDPLNSRSWSHAIWTSASEADFKTDGQFQPIYKLHGSSNWTRDNGEFLLIMGGSKVHEIGQTPILKWYANVFDESLMADNARLMVIGYSFRDEHINAAINRGVERGLKLFIVAPEGAELAHQLNPTRAAGHITAPTRLEAMVEESLIGASRRGL